MRQAKYHFKVSTTNDLKKIAEQILEEHQKLERLASKESRPQPQGVRRREFAQKDNVGKGKTRVGTVKKRVQSLKP